jgi:hypothetical protein
MRTSLKDSIAAFFDPLVVVTMMTTLGLIVGLLAYASSQAIIWKIAVLCLQSDSLGSLGLEPLKGTIGTIGIHFMP